MLGAQAEGCSLPGDSRKSQVVADPRSRFPTGFSPRSRPFRLCVSPLSKESIPSADLCPAPGIQAFAPSRQSGPCDEMHE